MDNNDLLDLEQLKEMESLLGDNFGMLLEIFLKDSQGHAENICSWDSADKNKDVMMAAHTLKSSAANLGLNKLANQCNVIETACREEGEIDIPTLTAGMKSLYDESISSLQQASAS